MLLAEAVRSGGDMPKSVAACVIPSNIELVAKVATLPGSTPELLQQAVDAVELVAATQPPPPHASVLRLSK